jgi:hypothetical protein
MPKPTRTAAELQQIITDEVTANPAVIRERKIDPRITFDVGIPTLRRRPDKTSNWDLSTFNVRPVSPPRKYLEVKKAIMVAIGNAQEKFDLA